MKSLFGALVLRLCAVIPAACNGGNAADDPERIRYEGFHAYSLPSPVDAECTPLNPPRKASGYLLLHRNGAGGLRVVEEGTGCEADFPTDGGGALDLRDWDCVAAPDRGYGALGVRARLLSTWTLDLTQGTFGYRGTLRWNQPGEGERKTCIELNAQLDQQSAGRPGD